MDIRSVLPDEAQRSIESLARDAIESSRNAVLVNLRFLARSMTLLPSVAADGYSLATDGRRLIYGPRDFLGRYAASPQQAARDCLHTLLHCVFLHPFIDHIERPAVWDAACDIAVESVIDELDLAVCRCPRQQDHAAQVHRLKEAVDPFTAEKLYRHLCDSDIDDDAVSALRAGFYADDHALWYRIAVGKGDDASTAPGDGEAAQGQGMAPGKAGTHDGKRPEDREHRSRSQQGHAPDTMKEQPENARPAAGERHADTITLDRSRERWKNAAYEMGVELDTFAKLWGSQGAGLSMMLRQATRDHQDYGEFLRKFAVNGEHMRLSPDEFDYGYYCYGLSLYGDMPLIEPVEYVEERRIRDFVIAIDTSASTKDELVHRFLAKTYGILHQSGGFFQRANIYIIQCDAQIADVVHVASPEEFDEYLAHMEVKGLGGTDFRPVFEYVDGLIDQGELQNMAGLVYFTDGQGTYPAVKPAYDAAFVFVDDWRAAQRVPSWAMTLELDSSDIEGFAPPVQGDRT